MGYLFSVLVFVECGKLNEWAIGLNAFPAVETDNKAMHGEKQVVIRLLECLGDCVEFALVGAGIVGLSLSGHRTDEI